MAIELQATYSKKLGLPNYSSHCYVVSLRTELSDLSQVEAESTRLYALLQQSVDKEVQEVGFLPDATTYGMDQGQPNNRLNNNGHGTNGHAHARNGNNSKPVTPDRDEDEDAAAESDMAWNCSDKQRELIQKLGKQAKMDWQDVERIATARFSQPVKLLDRKQASVLIEALFAHREENSGTGRRARR